MFREQLVGQDVLSDNAVRAVQQRLNRTAGTLAMLIVGVAAVGMALFAAARGVLAIVAILLLAWLGSSYVQTRAHLSRYRRDLIAVPRDASDPPPDPETLEDSKK